MKGSPVEQDETLLDNWIKELESGIQGMADLTGVPAEVSNILCIVHVQSEVGLCGAWCHKLLCTHVYWLC